MIQAAIQHFLQRNQLTRLTPKAVLFDMDGVLFDSMPFHTRAWYTAISGKGIPCTQEEFFLFEGRTGESTINELYKRTFNREATQEECNTLYKEKADLFNAISRSNPMRGATEVLQKVNKTGLETLIVTGSGQQTLIEKLNHAYPNQFVREKMITASDVKYGKPHPEPYLLGLEKAGVMPHEAFVVENAPLGVAAGHAAGIFTIAVNTGPIADHILLDEGADILFPDMHALAEKWEELVALCAETTV